MSEYNMTHTGRELDDAINKVNEGYINPEGETDITENGTHDVRNFAIAKVNVPNNNGNSVTPDLVITLTQDENGGMWGGYQPNPEITLNKHMSFEFLEAPIAVYNKIYNGEKVVGVITGSYLFNSGYDGFTNGENRIYAEAVNVGIIAETNRPKLRFLFVMENALKNTTTSFAFIYDIANNAVSLDYGPFVEKKDGVWVSVSES